MRTVVSLLALSVSAPALAGGIGVFGTAGLHGERTYFYDSSREFEQYSLPQTIMSGGAGVELLLGDRDDRIVGLFRGYWLVDAPQRDPAELTQLVDPDDVVAAYREEAHHVGIGAVGLSWGVVGNPDNLLINAVGLVGSGFLTNNHEEFLMGELGAGASYRLNRAMQVHGNLTYQIRHRKGFQHGGGLYVGARYFFD